jgi:hypothetical protein
MPSEFKEGIEYVGHLSKVELWPTVNNDPGRVQVIRITFEIYSLLPDRQELWRNWQTASFDVIVGSAIKPLTMAHKSLALAVGVENPVLADDWFRLDPQQGDGTANRKPGRWVQLTFKPVQPGEAPDYRQMFERIVPFDTGDYKIVHNAAGRGMDDLVSIGIAAERLGPPWNYQKLSRKIKRWKEQGLLPSKLIEETPRGQTRVYFRYLKTLLK